MELDFHNFLHNDGDRGVDWDAIEIPKTRIRPVTLFRDSGNDNLYGRATRRCLSEFTRTPQATHTRFVCLRTLDNTGHKIS